MSDEQRPVTPDDITAAARKSFDGATDDRLRFLLQRLVEHLHAYARDVRLTTDEWQAAINFLTETGHTCTDRRQEFILLSDTLGLSMFVDALRHPTPTGATESTGRQPWRPAHLHLMVSAPGYRTVATHFFDRTSPHLDSDAVFGVKPSLVVDFVPHGPDEPGAPEGWAGTWYSLKQDVVLVPADG